MLEMFLCEGKRNLGKKFVYIGMWYISGIRRFELSNTIQILAIEVRKSTC
jgi:hypothetical protein